MIVPIHSVDAEGDSIILTVSNLPSFGVFTDSGNGSGSITFTPDFTQSGTYNNILIRATDDAVPSSSSTEAFRLNVANVNRNPVLDRNNFV